VEVVSDIKQLEEFFMNKLSSSSKTLERFLKDPSKILRGFDKILSIRRILELHAKRFWERTLQK